MDKTIEKLRVTWEKVGALTGKRGLYILLLGFAILGYVLAGLGRKENCLKADQQVSFASEEKQLRDLVATDATPEIEVQLEEILFLKLVEMPLEKAEKGITPNELVKMLGWAKQARLETTPISQILRLTYGTTVDGRDQYQFEFTSINGTYLLTALQAYQPVSTNYSQMHPLKKTAFASFTVGKENQKTGTGLEEILKQVGLPQSLGLNRKEGKTFLTLTYRTQDGMVFLTLQAQANKAYQLSKMG